jgi:hypothetical protein
VAYLHPHSQEERPSFKSPTWKEKYSKPNCKRSYFSLLFRLIDIHLSIMPETFLRFFLAYHPISQSNL